MSINIEAKKTIKHDLSSVCVCCPIPTIKLYSLRWGTWI